MNGRAMKDGNFGFVGSRQRNSGAQNLNFSDNRVSKPEIAQGSCGFAPQDMLHHSGNGMVSGHLVDL